MGLGSSIVSGIIGAVGANKRSGEARVARRRADELALEAIRAAKHDQARAIKYRDEDEARLRKATGFNFNKLVRQAERAGFNPLTVLQATGGAGYDGRGAVLTTPFVGMAENRWNRVSTFAGMSGAVVDYAGGAADAIAGAVRDYAADRQRDRELDQQDRQLDMQEREMLLRYTGGSSFYGSPASGAGVRNGSPFSPGPVASSGPFGKWAQSAVNWFEDWEAGTDVLPVTEKPMMSVITAPDGVRSVVPNSDDYDDGLGSWLRIPPLIGYINRTWKRRLAADWAEGRANRLQINWGASFGGPVVFPSDVRPIVTPGYPNEPLRGGY